MKNKNNKSPRSLPNSFQANDFDPYFLEKIEAVITIVPVNFSLILLEYFENVKKIEL